MLELTANFFDHQFIEYWQQTLAICGLILLLDAAIMSQLKGSFRTERSHYILCLISIGCYIAIFPQSSDVFRDNWIQILTALYVYDLSMIAREWRQLKASYRVFYTVHHCVSLCLFVVWHFTFVPFTDAMAIGALLWVSADLWRWCEQLWRLSGHKASQELRATVDYLERWHRLFAYGIYLWVLDFQFKHTSEIVLLVSGIIMDIVDSYFVRQSRRTMNIRQLLAKKKKQSQPELPEEPEKAKDAA